MKTAKTTIRQRFARSLVRFARRVAGSRSYNGARINRLNSDWPISPSSMDANLRMYLRPLRSRCRHLERNNDHVLRFLNLVEENVIGAHGIKLQVRAPKLRGEGLDNALNTKIENHWKRWGKHKICSANGKLSWVDCQRLFMRQLARDGEALVRKIVADNDYGLSLQFIDVDWLDETHNHLYPDGRRIIMGVEVDPYGKPLAYWLTPPRYDFYHRVVPGNEKSDRVRVPADQIIHEYLFHRPDQTRGVPWMHTAMERLWMLGQYEEAEMVAARIGASQMAFLIPPENDENAGVPEADEEKRAANQFEVEPGGMPELLPGYKVENWNPNHPTTAFDPFTKAILRGIGMGLNVAYSSISGDLSDVNFSSIRAGIVAERDAFRKHQSWTSEHFSQEVYDAWLKSAFLNNALGVSALFYERINEPIWVGRGWGWVDPFKEVQAHVLAIENGLDSRTDALAETGRDVEDVFDALAQEKELADEKGITLGTVTALAPEPDKEGVAA